MKKKLKVKKAALGSSILGRRPGIGGRPINVNPNLINPVRPGMQINPNPIGPRQPIGNLSNMGPINVNPNLINPVRPGMQQPIQTQPGFAVDPIRQPVGMGTLPNNLGPTAPVGDPRLGAPMIPGNRMQEMMRGPTQAAPVQPVPAMKKGGVVRGGRAEIKGTRPAKLS